MEKVKASLFIARVYAMKGLMYVHSLILCLFVLILLSFFLCTFTWLVIIQIMVIVDCISRKRSSPCNPTEDEINKYEEAVSSMVLPPEVIMEILTWLPLKPLARAQLVCKEWRSTIRDRRFMEKHMNRSPHLRHCYNVNAKAEAEEAGDFFYYHGCDGLLLMKNHTTLRHFLWNPATKLLLKLPNPHTGMYGMTLSFARSTKYYKVVSFFKDSNKLRCQVLTLGSPSMAWRRLGFSPQEKNPNTANAEVLVVPAGGVPHCVVLTKSGAEIVSVDLETELLTLNNLPGGVFRDAGAAKVMDCDGKLGLAVVDKHKQELQVMVLEDFKKKRWCRNKEVIPLPFLEEDEDFIKGEKKLVPLMIKEGEIWFWLEEEKIFVYTIETGEIRDEVRNEGMTVPSILYMYRPSMVTFQGMRADDEIACYRPSDLSS